MGTPATLKALRERHQPPPPKDSAMTTVLYAAEMLGPGPFSLERWIVKSWELDSERFGLHGYKALYPDSNKVSCVIYGRRGVLGRGLIQRVGPKLFRLPREKLLADA